MDEFISKNYNECVKICKVDKDEGISPNLLTEVYQNFKDDITCLICLNICSINFKICRFCDKPFCSKCIGLWTKTKRKCPICKEIFRSQKGILFNNLLSKMKFQCCYNDTGCNLEVFYENYASHLSQCSYAPATCLGCDKEGEKKVIDKHVKKCKGFYKNCEYCHENLFLTQSHYKVCKRVPVDCPECSQNIKRYKFTTHNNGECFEKIMKKCAEKKIENSYSHFQIPSHLSSGSDRDSEEERDFSEY
jgi:hypothetical protein